MPVPVRMRVAGFVSSLKNDVALVQKAFVNAQLGSGNTQVFASPGVGYILRVQAAMLINGGSSAAANTFQFQSGNTAISPPFYLGAGGQLPLQWAPGGWFDCLENQALNINLALAQSANQLTQLHVLVVATPVGT